jgi:hypothetical protein
VIIYIKKLLVMEVGVVQQVLGQHISKSFSLRVCCSNSTSKSLLTFYLLVQLELLKAYNK